MIKPIPIYRDGRRISYDGGMPRTRLIGEPRRTYEVNGFIVYRRFFSPEELDRDGLDILRDSRLMELIAAVAGIEMPLLVGELENFHPSRFERAPHWFDGERPRVWISGTTFRQWEGPLEVVPGSHLAFETVPAEELYTGVTEERPDADEEDEGQYFKLLHRAIDAGGSRPMERRKLPTRPGDVVILHRDLLARRARPSLFVTPPRVEAVCGSFI